MKKKFTLLLVISLVSLILYISSSPQDQTEEIISEKTERNINKAVKNIKKASLPIKEQGTTPQKSNTSKEQTKVIDTSNFTPEQSRKALMEIMTESMDTTKNMKDTISSLKKYGLIPNITKEGDPAIGDFYTIRTENSLPGTRYFHAQFESSPEDGVPRVQHLSFELPPGPKSLEKANDILSTMMPEKASPVTDTAEFIRYKFKNGQHAYMRVLDKEDIEEDHPFNARTIEDIGTVMVVVETDQHPHRTTEDDERESEAEHNHNHSH